jgi:hypothetical protein
MDWWVYVTNIAVGGIVWALTRFGIPFVNREAHLDIPYDAATESELSKFVKQIWDKEILNHLMRYHAMGAPTPPPPPPGTPAPPTYTFKTTTNTAPPAPAATTNPDSGVPNA